MPDELALPDDGTPATKEQGKPDAGSESKASSPSSGSDSVAPNKPGTGNVGQPGAIKQSAIDPGDQLLMKYKPMTLEPRLGSGIIDTVKAAVKALFPSGQKAPVRTLRLFKQDDGQLRFFVTWTNTFKDKHGEIFSAAAHKEYVDWATETGVYPELRLWHTPGTGIGKTDWLEFDGTFVVASGLITAGKEEIAERVALLPNVGVSHGYFGLLDGQNVYAKYRTFELSLLTAPANVWTDYDLVDGGSPMFSDKKKEFLKQAGVPEAEIAALETQTEALADQLKAAGIEYKEAGEESGIVGEIRVLSEAVQSLTGTVKAVQDDMTRYKEATDAKLVEATKALDTKVAEVLTPRAPVAPGFEASKAPETVVQGKKETVDNGWFAQVVAGAAQKIG